MEIGQNNVDPAQTCLFFSIDDFQQCSHCTMGVPQAQPDL